MNKDKNVYESKVGGLFDIRMPSKDWRVEQLHSQFSVSLCAL